MTITALFNSLHSRDRAADAKGDAPKNTLEAGLERLESRMSAHEQAMREQMNAHEQVMGERMRAHERVMDERMTAHEQVMGERVRAIEAAVAEGAEEHKAWQAALDKTNERLDQLMMHLLARTG